MTDTVKVKEFGRPKIIAVNILKFKQCGFTIDYSNVSKRCRGNGSLGPDQTAPRSDRSRLIWVNTVCLELSVQTLKIIITLNIFRGHINGR